MKTTHGRPWKTVIVPVFTAAGIVFSANILSAQTETQVSPSVINLAAFGGTVLTIHTPVSYTHLTLPTTWSRCRSRWSPCR